MTGLETHLECVGIRCGGKAGNEDLLFSGIDVVGVRIDLENEVD